MVTTVVYVTIHVGIVWMEKLVKNGMECVLKDVNCISFIPSVKVT